MIWNFRSLVLWLSHRAVESMLWDFFIMAYCHQPLFKIPSKRPATLTSNCQMLGEGTVTKFTCIMSQVQCSQGQTHDLLLVMKVIWQKCMFVYMFYVLWELFTHIETSLTVHEKCHKIRPMHGAQGSSSERSLSCQCLPQHRISVFKAHLTLQINIW